MKTNLTFEKLPEAVTFLIDQVAELKQLIQTQPSIEEPINKNDLLTIKEACELLNISRGTLYRYEQHGTINIYGIGGRRLLKRSELMDSLILKK